MEPGAIATTRLKRSLTLWDLILHGLLREMLCK